jgi:NADH-quinone oxidoreductase subunit F
MKRLTSVEEFRSFRSRILAEKAMGSDKPTLVVCAGTGGQASGSNDVIRAIKKHILDNFLQLKVDLRITGCQGFCEMDPFVVVEPNRRLYPRLRMEDIPRIVDSAIEGRVLEDLIYRDEREQKKYECQNDISFFKKQTRTILGANERLDPIRVVDYLEQGGYAALERVLTEMDQLQIIEQVKLSGLRGRGGAGFLAGRKWELARAAGSGQGQKYIICNADEGDPGAYMDRSLLEGNPHAIIEGMLIAAMAIGASQGYIYVRSEYPLAIKHTLIALRQAREMGLLGRDILGTGSSCDIEIVRGAGAFVCGEETALIRSIEGYMGEPRQRPPYPIEKGLGGCPTCINNVETLANIPVIINWGAEKYAEVGVPGNTGTKIFSLVGKIRNTGLVEVPLGTKLSDVIYGIGGGPVGKARIKAVQTGGPSGGCIPASMLDIPIDYDSLSKVGSIMGSGGMIVMDDNTCMVDVARYFMDFLRGESCGKCFTCRKGTQRMYEILDGITKGEASMEDLDLLYELAEVVRDTSMCGLGQSAPNPVFSTLRYFRKEFERHVKDKRCDAFVCSDLVGAPCQSACPLGTQAWRYVAHIQRGEYEEAYRTIREVNPFPSVCARVCHHPCETRCKLGTTGSDPVSIRALKRFITDRIDPATFVSERTASASPDSPRVAVIGAGPSGLTAAHMLSLKGYRVTVFEADDRPGGMLYSAIPEYRLPMKTVEKEIAAILDDQITVKCNAALGRDITIESLFESGYQSILLAFGSHKSRPLQLDNEEIDGIYPSIEFLKAANKNGEALVRGYVGVVGGGNSAFDAARVARRQQGVASVTILYRRTKDEMPAFEEEIEAAQQEGIEIRTLVTPVRVIAEDGRLAGLECLNNGLGEVDQTGRRRPVPKKGTEHVIPLDSLIVAISEDPGYECVDSTTSGVKVTSWNTIEVDGDSMMTSREGVFAAGDAVTGPNTVVDAIADGKRAAGMIDRFLRGKPLVDRARAHLPCVYVEPASGREGETDAGDRIETPRAPAEWRTRSFAEVEVSLTEQEAQCEARRCLRCDLEFTRPNVPEEEPASVGVAQL